MVGGGLGGWGGSEAGDSIGEAIGPSISELFTDATKTPGTPTTMPLAAAGAAAGAGAAGAGITRSKAVGAKVKELTATAGPNSISSSGDLTLKISNFQDLISQSQEKKSFWGLFS